MRHSTMSDLVFSTIGVAFSIGIFVFIGFDSVTLLVIVPLFLCAVILIDTLRVKIKSDKLYDKIKNSVIVTSVNKISSIYSGVVIGEDNQEFVICMGDLAIVINGSFTYTYDDVYKEAFQKILKTAYKEQQRVKDSTDVRNNAILEKVINSYKEKK